MRPGSQLTAEPDCRHAGLFPTAPGGDESRTPRLAFLFRGRYEADGARLKTPCRTVGARDRPRLHGNSPEDHVNIVPVILCGGAGTRLWPLSRTSLPKQLLRLEKHSLLQETVLRAHGEAITAPVLVCADEYEHLVRDQLDEISCPPHTVIVEPVGRNTAPAVTMAALLLENDPDTLLLIMPSDHFIRDPKAFATAVHQGAQAAADGLLVSFGIEPTSPHTGYGYIHGGEPLPAHPGCFSVQNFVEKPDVRAAQTYLLTGEYYWNGGIFLFSPQTFLRELETFCPDMLTACRAASETAHRQPGRVAPLLDAYKTIENNSVDYTVMEHTTRAAVVPVHMGWSDVGTWEALWEQTDKDANGNAMQGDVFALETANSYLYTDAKLLVTLGVENLVAVVTEDAVLVASRDHSERVKDVVARLKVDERTEVATHRVNYRPWGSFKSVDRGDRFHVKQIVVKPGGKLSLQKHWHRSEHWIVVKGVAMVTCDTKIFPLTENQSTFIPAGSVHRLENPGKLPLHVIEVQSGAYLEEDDIIRLADSYGRAEETATSSTEECSAPEADRSDRENA